jgi:sporulation protein YabP
MQIEERRQNAPAPASLSHSLSMENREKMTVTGVENVENFTETMVSLRTNMGKLCIKGAELDMQQLNVETGALELTGKITSCEYTEIKSRRKGSLFDSLFR